MAGQLGTLAYRLMLLQYRLMDRLHLDPPETHLPGVAITPGMTVVDYGCGPGRYLPLLAERVGPTGRVYGVDIQPLGVQAARERATRLGLKNVEVVLADGYHTTMPAAFADMVLLLDVFHAIEERPALLAEIHRLLKPDGRLFMDPGHMPLEAAREAVRASGRFRLVESDGSHMLWETVR